MGVPEIKYGDSLCFIMHMATGLWLSYQAPDVKSTRLGPLKRRVSDLCFLYIYHNLAGIISSHYYIVFTFYLLKWRMWWRSQSIQIPFQPPFCDYINTILDSPGWVNFIRSFLFSLLLWLPSGVSPCRRTHGWRLHTSTLSAWRITCCTHHPQHHQTLQPLHQVWGHSTLCPLLCGGNLSKDVDHSWKGSTKSFGYKNPQTSK